MIRLMGDDGRGDFIAVVRWEFWVAYHKLTVETIA